MCTSDGKLWTKDLRGVPSVFERSMISDYLISSPEKDFDGESLRSYKALRAYQLFEERHIHDVEFCPTWPRKNPSSDNAESPFCFLRCKCFPSQDTAKQPYHVVVCLDKQTGCSYGGHCRCVSGLGQTCSHVAGLLFALEDFISRGFTKLPDGQSTSDVLCAWSKPSGSQKVEAKPLREVPVRKAVAGGRKRKTRWERYMHITSYDPRENGDRVIHMDSVGKLVHGLRRGKAKSCAVTRFWDDLQTRKEMKSTSSSEQDLNDFAFDVDIHPCAEVEVTSTATAMTERERMISERQTLLFSIAGVLPVTDKATVSNLEGHVTRIMSQLSLTPSAKDELEKAMRVQSASFRWHAEHVGRVTASTAHRAINAATSQSPDCLVRDIMKYKLAPEKPLRKDDPRQYGLKLEPRAREAYVALKQAEGPTIAVKESGLLVSEQFPFLATSTDGIITNNKEHGPGVLKIKCPVSQLTVVDLAATPNGFF